MGRAVPSSRSQLCLSHSDRTGNRCPDLCSNRPRRGADNQNRNQIDESRAECHWRGRMLERPRRTAVVKWARKTYRPTEVAASQGGRCCFTRSRGGGRREQFWSNTAVPPPPLSRRRPAAVTPPPPPNRRRPAAAAGPLPSTDRGRQPPPPPSVKTAPHCCPSLLPPPPTPRARCPTPAQHGPLLFPPPSSPTMSVFTATRIASMARSVWKGPFADPLVPFTITPPPRRPRARPSLARAAP